MIFILTYRLFLNMVLGDKHKKYIFKYYTQHNEIHHNDTEPSNTQLNVTQLSI
jgi:hypothetical protein